MPEIRTATNVELRRAAGRLQKIVQKLPLDEAYAIVSGNLHIIFDQLPARTVDRLLLLFVTHALESRDAGAQGRPANFSPLHQLSRWADVRREGTSVHVTVTLSSTLTQTEWAGVAAPDAPWNHQP